LRLSFWPTRARSFAPACFARLRLKPAVYQPEAYQAQVYQPEVDHKAGALRDDAERTNLLIAITTAATAAASAPVSAIATATTATAEASASGSALGLGPGFVHVDGASADLRSV
jgi:hypothetical protein